MFEIVFDDLDDLDERSGNDDTKIVQHRAKGLDGNVHEREQRRQNNDAGENRKDKVEGHRRSGIGTVVLVRTVWTNTSLIR